MFWKRPRLVDEGNFPLWLHYLQMSSQSFRGKAAACVAASVGKGGRDPTFVVWAELQGLFTGVLTRWWDDGAVATVKLPNAGPLRRVNAVLVALILNIKLLKLQLLGQILRSLLKHIVMISSLFYCISRLSVCNYINKRLISLDRLLNFNLIILAD